MDYEFKTEDLSKEKPLIKSSDKNIYFVVIAESIVFHDKQEIILDKIIIDDEDKVLKSLFHEFNEGAIIQFLAKNNLPFSPFVTHYLTCISTSEEYFNILKSLCPW